MREPSRTGQTGRPKRERSCFRELAKRGRTGAALDGTRHSLRKQQPPGNDVPVPGVDDRIDSLVEKIAIYDFDIHLSRTRMAAG